MCDSFSNSIVDKRLKPCKTCGETIPKEPQRSWIQYAKKVFCSRMCSTKSQSRKNTIKCVNCSIDIVRSPSHVRKTENYCSRKCRTQYNSISKPCEVCGVNVTKPQSNASGEHLYCSMICSGISKRKNNGQTQGRRSPEDLTWKREILRLGEYKCAMCGSDRNLEAHHIKSIEFFPELRHDMSNGLCVCHNCHYYGIHRGMPNYKHGRYCKKNVSIPENSLFGDLG